MKIPWKSPWNPIESHRITINHHKSPLNPNKSPWKSHWLTIFPWLFAVFPWRSRNPHFASSTPGLWRQQGQRLGHGRCLGGWWFHEKKMVDFHGIFMVIYWDSMGIYGDSMGFYWIFGGDFYGDLFFYYNNWRYLSIGKWWFYSHWPVIW